LRFTNPQNPGINSGTPEGCAVPTPLMDPVDCRVEYDNFISLYLNTCCILPRCLKVP